MKEFLWDVDLLMNQSRMGDGVMMVGTKVFNNLFGSFDIGRDVTGNSNANRGFDVSNLLDFWMMRVKFKERNQSGEKNVASALTTDSSGFITRISFMLQIYHCFASYLNRFGVPVGLWDGKLHV